MQLTQKESNKLKNFCDKYKTYVGYDGWTIIIDKNTLENSSSIAEVGTCIYEKTMTITFSKDFLKFTDKQKANVLMHEMVHSRVRYAEKKIDEIKSIEEEHLVNDIVRGYEMMGKLELN